MGRDNEHGLGDGVMRTLKVADAIAEETERNMAVPPHEQHHAGRYRHGYQERVKAYEDKPLPEDVVVLPKHYARYTIEPIYFVGENNLDFLLGNVIKYSVRAEFKHESPVEDTLKAVRYLIMRCKKLLGIKGWAGPYATNIEENLREEFRGA